MKGIYFYFLVFFIYSIIGYICEVLYVYSGTKKWVNRGFLNGPYVPLYGMGGLLITYLLTGYYNDPIVVFVMGVIICSCLEYFISCLMEKMFHNRWWDYSCHKYNINGRVCAKNSFLFGICGLVVIYAANPFIFGFLNSIDYKVQKTAAILLMIIFITDLIISIIEALRVNNISNHLDDILNEYTKNKNIKLNRIKTRLFDAFPYLAKNEGVVKRLKSLKKDFVKRKKL
jgi:uncharacterized membrane protein